MRSTTCGVGAKASEQEDSSTSGRQFRAAWRGCCKRTGLPELTGCREGRRGIGGGRWWAATKQGLGGRGRGACGGAGDGVRWQVGRPRVRARAVSAGGRRRIRLARWLQAVQRGGVSVCALDVCFGWKRVQDPTFRAVRATCVCHWWSTGGTGGMVHRCTGAGRRPHQLAWGRRAQRNAGVGGDDGGATGASAVGSRRPRRRRSPLRPPAPAPPFPLCLGAIDAALRAAPIC